MLEHFSDLFAELNWSSLIVNWTSRMNKCFSEKNGNIDRGDE